MCFAIIILIRAESIELDRSTFRKSVQRMLFIIFITEITTYVLYIFIEWRVIEHVLHKLGSEMIFMTFNCSLCFAFGQFLKKDRKTTLRIWWLSMSLTILWQLSWNSYYARVGKLGFLANFMISCYLMSLLKEIKESAEYVPIVVQRLFHLEIFLTSINAIIYMYTLISEFTHSQNDFFRPLYHINYVLSLVKIYIVISEWKAESGARCPTQSDKSYSYSVLSMEKVPPSEQH